MHSNSTTSTLLLSAALLMVGSAFAQSDLRPAASDKKTQAAARQSEKQNYPLKTCVVSDEALDKDAIEYVHKEAGKPDRLVKFCCDGCIDDFKKEPAKFLAKIDAAAKAKSGK